jgi:hypothetical protein
MKPTIKTTTKKDEKADTNVHAQRRLRLAKETLRTLSTDELRSVAGGMSTGSKLC